MYHGKWIFKILILYSSICVINDAKLIGKEFGFKDEKIKLTCHLPDFDFLYFVWKDKVYNEQSNPSVIYNSSTPEINKKYEEVGFSVSGNVLYVQDKYQDASGEYFCEVFWANGTTFSSSYEVMIIMDSNCSRDQEVKEGEPIFLHCNFSASFAFSPEWTDSEGQTYKSEFHSEFDIHTLLTSFNATWKHHNTTFTCVTEDLVICSNKLSVTYKTRDIIIPKGDKNIHAGDNLTCKALGNPIPEVTLELKGAEYSKVSGMGEVSIQIMKNLIGQKLRAKCEAWNSIDDDVTKLVEESLLVVVEKPISEQSSLDDVNNSFFIIIIVTVAVILLFLIIGSITILNRKKCRKDHTKTKGTTLLKAEPRKDYNSDMI